VIGFPRGVAEVLARAFTTPGCPDDLGNIDFDMIEQVAPLIDAFCRVWFRQDVLGFEKVPRGACMIVGNHNAGISFLEMLGMGARWYMERGRGEPIYGMAHDQMLVMPGLGNFLMHCGGLRAAPENGENVLRRGAKVLVCPGGNLEAFRPFSQRHKVNLGGRKGFLKLAIRTGAPIVPVVFVGGHSSFMVLSDGRFIAEWLGPKKLLRVDTWPLILSLPWGLTLGPVFHLPLPVKCVTRFLDPITVDAYSPSDADDPAVLADLYERVVGEMQAGVDAEIS